MAQQDVNLEEILQRSGSSGILRVGTVRAYLIRDEHRSETFRSPNPVYLEASR